MYATLKKAQPNALRILENSIKNNRLSHAYLFTGPNGTYKKEMAYHLAMMLYCKESVPCYKCPSCLAILENRHLNVHYIEPFGQSIKKEQIIALQEEFSKTSLLDGPRVYIINEAEKLGLENRF
jgi:DNA polymerase-3 subunit delta'